ncbi:PcfJ domain-containing protein, partial [Proteus mirabilis]|uniref:PcfJ domain-containing protein n=1 Tax=Proteus mirabilis TaxID=584 RepID=UPI0019534D3A
GVLDPWLPEVNTGQLHIVPLTTPFAILDEATSMQNCIADYGALIAAGAYRLFSVRSDGERVATLLLTLCEHGQTLVLADIKGPDNEDCSLN